MKITVYIYGTLRNNQFPSIKKLKLRFKDRRKFYNNNNKGI